MSHEGERPTGDGIQSQPERAPPHWLDPLLGGVFISIWTPLIIVASRRFIRGSPLLSRTPMYFDVTDMAVHKTNDVFGIVIQRAAFIRDAVGGWIVP